MERKISSTDQLKVDCEGCLGKLHFENGQCTNMEEVSTAIERVANDFDDEIDEPGSLSIIEECFTTIRSLFSDEANYVNFLYQIAAALLKKEKKFYLNTEY